MANPEHMRILKKGAGEWNSWRASHPSSVPEFFQADLPRVSLVGAALRGSIFRGAHLQQADLAKADLRQAEFCWGQLTDVNFSQADLTCADLRYSDLQGARLVRTNLTSAHLEGSDLREATALGTIFADIDLSKVRGLDKMRHLGPSTVGIDTIQMSHGSIPEIFLRGCGASDDLIEFNKLVSGRPLVFYSCFISYSTLDREFAERLYVDLQSKGVRCWFAAHDIKGGRKIHEQIDEAIRLHDKLLLILSEHSMSSDWVMTEIARARKREAQEKRQMLFPVALVPYDPVISQWECFDAERGKDSAREVREYYIPDFSNWKSHDSYQTAFERLVKDLKAETQTR